MSLLTAAERTELREFLAGRGSSDLTRALDTIDALVAALEKQLYSRRCYCRVSRVVEGETIQCDTCAIRTLLREVAKETPNEH